MDKLPEKKNVTKVYCDKCDSIFDSKEKYEAHYQNHSSGVNCESCPLDVAIQKILSIFRVHK